MLQIWLWLFLNHHVLNACNLNLILLFAWVLLRPVYAFHLRGLSRLTPTKVRGLINSQDIHVQEVNTDSETAGACPAKITSESSSKWRFTLRLRNFPKNMAIKQLERILKVNFPPQVKFVPVSKKNGSYIVFITFVILIFSNLRELSYVKSKVQLLSIYRRTLSPKSNIKSQFFYLE